jgi:hypothetical protein
MKKNLETPYLQDLVIYQALFRELHYMSVMGFIYS